MISGEDVDSMETESGSGSRTGSDTTGSIRAELDDAGRLERLEISARWREKLGSERFVGALSEAILEASRGIRDLTPTDPPSPTGPVPLLSALDSPSRAPLLNAAQRVMELAGEIISEAARRNESARHAATEWYAGSDERRNVEVKVSLLGELVALTVGEKWLEGASRDRLVDTVLTAFGDAYRRAKAARDSVPDLDYADLKQFHGLYDRDTLCRWLREEG